VEWNDTGKRILHAVCGVVAGFILGAFFSLRASLSFWLTGGIGALILGVGAFFATDEFWERFFKGGDGK
jgi:hypothetical protein